MSPLIVGSAGVFLLLLAFALNLLKILSESYPLYLLMNLLGAMMAAWYAYNEQIIPFVILELVWAGAAIVKLVLLLKKRLSFNESLD